MAWFVPVALAVSALAGAGTGIYSAVSGGGGKSGSNLPQISSLPGTPQPVDANKKAREEMKRRRKISLLTGGQTVQASGMGSQQSEDKKSLLGE